ncbi:hypothetical protein PPERSA_01984 [Pseudocohnilembus persalinus]|uniref:Uncharacterized protein n=1 Tax=Pseudocohnilembus persalinus TaxID=266149 RepID=A0A0V0QF80_PSEPJ|nr:hypothetical protein PPERSA_01984 [Pseudocohnilembus persalinus]|eukprot:KRX00805.1 hypothetical protein PPERSA_01984 [Pseudocohnilembus persalinus]
MHILEAAPKLIIIQNTYLPPSPYKLNFAFFITPAEFQPFAQRNGNTSVLYDHIRLLDENKIQKTQGPLTIEMNNNSSSNLQYQQGQNQQQQYSNFVNQPGMNSNNSNFIFSNQIRPLQTQYNQQLYRFGISTQQHVDIQIRQLVTDPQTGLPYETNTKNPKEKYPPLISVLMLLEELSSKFSFGFDLYFQMDPKMMSFIASTALNEEEGSRQVLSKFDIIECIRELSSSYDIFCLEEKDIFEIVTETDTQNFAQLVNLPYQFQITYASIYQNLKRQKQMTSSQNYQQQMYNSNQQGNFNNPQGQQQSGQSGSLSNQQYNQQNPGNNQYMQGQQGYGQQNNQQFNMQQGGQNQQYQNMYPNQIQNYPQQMMKPAMQVDINSMYQPNMNQPQNMNVQQQMPYNQQQQMYYNQPQVKKERKKRTQNSKKIQQQNQQQSTSFQGYGAQGVGQNDEQVYLSDQSQEDDDDEDDENELGRASMVTKKIKKLSYVSRASQLQTFNEVKQYLEPFFSTPRSTSTLSRFFVVFSTEPRPGMDDPTAYLERLDEQMIRFVEKYKEHTGQELEMYKKDYESEHKRLYAFQNTEFYGTTRRSLYSKHISTVANLMSQNKKEKFAFAAKDVLIINGAQGVRTHDLANKIDISKRLAAKKFKKKEVNDEKKKNIEALKQQKKNQPKVFHNIIANLPTPKGEKTKQQKFFEKPSAQNSKKSQSTNKSKEPKEPPKKEKKVEKPKKEKQEKPPKQEPHHEKPKDKKNKGGYNYNSQDTSYLSIKPTYNKLYAADKNFRSKRMQERQQKTIQLEDEKQIEQFAQQQLYGDSYLQQGPMQQSSQNDQQQQYEQQQQQQQMQEEHNHHQNNNNNNNHMNNNRVSEGYDGNDTMLEVEGEDRSQQQQQNNVNNSNNYNGEQQQQNEVQANNSNQQQQQLEENGMNSNNINEESNNNNNNNKNSNQQYQNNGQNSENNNYQQEVQNMPQQQNSGNNGQNNEYQQDQNDQKQHNSNNNNNNNNNNEESSYQQDQGQNFSDQQQQEQQQQSQQQQFQQENNKNFEEQQQQPQQDQQQQQEDQLQDQQLIQQQNQNQDQEQQQQQQV